MPGIVLKDKNTEMNKVVRTQDLMEKQTRRQLQKRVTGSVWMRPGTQEKLPGRADACAVLTEEA